MTHWIQTLPERIDSLRREYGVPGASVAVVKDGDLALVQGFGLLAQDRPATVDEHTLFGIGSCTKAFTAAAVGLLVQEGKLSWDDPVTRWLPGFQLFDPVATREITVRDLLCHRAGLATFAGDFMFYGSKYTDEEVLQRVRNVPLAFRLRAGYGYANVMYLAAGLVIKAVSGQDWETFVRRRLLEPLGMRRTLTHSRTLADEPNAAQPHMLYDGQLVTMPHLVFNNGAPAGALVSSAADMALWLRFQLTNGRVGGEPLLDESILEETRTPQVLIPVAPPVRRLFPRRHFLTYGLGWGLEDYGGRLVASHTGGLDGMLSLTAVVPEEQFGIVILTNRIPHDFNSVLYRTVLDEVLGFHDRDWRAVFNQFTADITAQQAANRQKLWDERPAGTQPSLPLESYTGEYTNPIYGGVTVALEAGQLVISLGAHPGVKGPLEHLHTDTFFCRWSWPSLEESLVPFSIGLSGKVERLKIRVADFVDPLVYEFTRV